MMRQHIGGLLALFLVLPLLAFSQNAQAQFTLSEAKEIAAFPLSLDKVEKNIAFRRRSRGRRAQAREAMPPKRMPIRLSTIKFAR